LVERLHRLFPDLNFEVKRVVAKGWPWNTLVAIEWTDHGSAADGEPYENEGAHWIRLRWGKGTYVHAYLETERLADACRRMAAAGIGRRRRPRSPISGGSAHSVMVQRMPAGEL